METAFNFIFALMTKLLLLFGTLLAFSCNDPKNLTLADVLRSDCFWDRTGESGVIGGLNSCYRFLPDGQCFYYYYNFYNKKRADSVYKYGETDVVVPSTWSTKGDTVLNARGVLLKVLSFTKNSVTIEGYLMDTIVLKKNCETFLGK
jgi:hypothetical protein